MTLVTRDTRLLFVRLDNLKGLWGNVPPSVVGRDGKGRGVVETKPQVGVKSLWYLQNDIKVDWLVKEDDMSE